jgi:hypothetical protein
MAKPQLTLMQRNAMLDCRKAGKLVRRRDGWATAPAAHGSYSFVTINSLIQRDLLRLVIVGRRIDIFSSRRVEEVVLTTLGREALPK